MACERHDDYVRLNVAMVVWYLKTLEEYGGDGTLIVLRMLRRKKGLNWNVNLHLATSQLY